MQSTGRGIAAAPESRPRAEDAAPARPRARRQAPATWPPPRRSVCVCGTDLRVDRRPGRWNLAGEALREPARRFIDPPSPAPGEPRSTRAGPQPPHLRSASC